MKLTLPNGNITLIDDEDFDLVSGYSWHEYVGVGGRSSYVRTELWKDGVRGKKLSMHRLIMDFPSNGLEVDHINGNGLDNRRENLRVCTPSQNGANRKLNSGSTSGYKGVYWDKNAGKWHAQIQAFGKNRHIGLFSNILEAARAYDREAIRLFGSFARPNLCRRSLVEVVS